MKPTQRDFDELFDALDWILKCANVRIDDPRCAIFDNARAVIARAREMRLAHNEFSASAADCEHRSLRGDNYALVCLDCGTMLDDA